MFGTALAALPVHGDIVRSEHFVESEPGVEIFVREVRRSPAADTDRPPILLLHGARVPGVASFDRAERGRNVLLREALAFLGPDETD